MDKELLKVCLKRYWKDSTVARVLSVDVSPAVGKLQNFLSTVKRIKMKVVLKNGRTVTWSVIVKVTDTSSIVSNTFQKEYAVFKIETKMYKTILKEMEYLMEEYEETEGILWCSLIHYVPYNLMVFEDLKSSGFNMMERGTFFNLDESLMAVHCLGRYHAMSKILEERGVINKNDYKPCYIFAGRGIQKYWHSCLKATMKGIKMHWGPKWESIVDRITLKDDTIVEKLVKIGELDESRFNLLNHGDCHKNNIMFRHDDRGKPIELRFLDFQIPHYGSPCCDLTYVMYLAVDRVVRRENYNLLLEVYHESLTTALEKFRYHGNVPDLKEIADGMDRMLFAGVLMYSVGFLAFLLKDVELYFDFEQIGATNGEKGIRMDLFTSESYREMISPELEILLTKYL